MEKNKEILSAILDAGELMLMSGAEVSRVESTIEHMAKAYGFQKVDVFTIIFSIVVTVKDGEGNIETQTRRIEARDTDLHKVERINALSRKVCTQPVTLEDFKEELRAIEQEKPYSPWIILAIYGIASAAFTVFFGGGVGDAVAAFLGGLVLRLILMAGNRLRLQNIVLTMLCSGAAGLMALLSVKLGIGQSLDQIIIGNIMLLTPGIALTNSLRDLIRGDLISGLLVLCEAVIRAVAIALGLAVVIWQFGGGF
ncbi:MAG: threonine/serine exporter family protein [Lachnospiraceae bacterium]|nr:threonine/serine exporter family protein [Lachnospiraceae bacterium]